MIRIHRAFILALFTAVGFGVLPAAACSIADVSVGTLPAGNTYSDSGCLVDDQSEQSFLFTTNTTETVDLYTTSWESGGFAPILTLFDSSGDELATDDGGVWSSTPSLDTCGARGIGTADGGTSCLDAYLTETLAAGNYRLVLTENGTPTSEGGNEATGNYTPVGSPEQSPNFEQYGIPNFSGQQWTGDPTTSLMFLSPNDGAPLSDAWDVTITAQSGSTPEPVTGVMGLSGILVTWAVARRRRRNRSQI